MAKRIEVATADASTVNPWHLIGWLSGDLELHGRITKAGWNQAVEADARFETEHPRG